MTVLDFTTRVDEIVGFEGTIDEAVEVFEAEPKLDEMFGLPIEAVPLIQDALESAILDINQACKWRPDEDSKRVIQKLNMAQALLR